MSDSRSAALVSIVMATFNCLDTIDEALNSLLDQTYQDWELILCDDASIDGTYEHLVEFAAKHPDRTILLRNSTNSKLAYSLNRCLDRVAGKYVARMDGDDISTPQRLERQVAYLAGHPKVDLVGTAIRRFDDNGLKDIVSLPSEPDRYSLRRGVPFAHATILARRGVYESLGGYTVSHRTERGQDSDLGFRFFAHGFVGRNLDEAFYLVREDEKAIRRRTFPVRWNSYRTTLIGFRSLGYPAFWYLRPTAGLLKSFVPPRAVSLYRRVQHQRYRRSIDSNRERRT